MIDVTTPDGRKALRDWFAARKSLFAGSPELEAVPLLLDALDDREAIIRTNSGMFQSYDKENLRKSDEINELTARLKQKRIEAENSAGALEAAVEKLNALQSENASLRQRVEALEKVRAAAENLADKIEGVLMPKDTECRRVTLAWDALRTALAAAGKGE